MSREVRVVFDEGIDFDFCRVDYPGPNSVYGKEARISFYGHDGKLIRCRKATDDELVRFQTAPREDTQIDDPNEIRLLRELEHALRDGRNNATRRVTQTLKKLNALRGFGRVRPEPPIPPHPALPICNRLGCDPKHSNLRCLLPDGHEGPGDAWAEPLTAPKPERPGVLPSAHRPEYMTHARRFCEDWIDDPEDEEMIDEATYELESMMARAHDNGYVEAREAVATGMSQVTTENARIVALEAQYATAKECLQRVAAERDMWKKGCDEWTKVGTEARARIVELEEELHRRSEVSEPAAEIADHDRAIALVVEHKIPWCRARLMHVLAACEEQGSVLEDVLEELLPEADGGRGDHDNYESGGQIAGAIEAALRRTGWLRRERATKPNPESLPLSNPAPEKEIKKHCGKCDGFMRTDGTEWHRQGCPRAPQGIADAEARLRNACVEPGFHHEGCTCALPRTVPNPSKPGTPRGTTFSDGELERWSARRRADDSVAFWKKSSVSAVTAADAMAGELLAARRILRDHVARFESTTQDPLVLRIVDLLGMNLTPEQPLFQEWPQMGNSEDE